MGIPFLLGVLTNSNKGYLKGGSSCPYKKLFNCKYKHSD